MSSISKSQYKQLVKLLLKLSRYDLYRLTNITREQFGKKTNTLNSLFKQGKCSYRQIKNEAMNQLIKSGASNPTNIDLKQGTYLIVSDSHGKHTSRGMFRLLNNLNNFLKFNAVIHIGHILDDDNDISYLWKDFQNFIVVSKQQQIKQIERRRQDYGYNVINGFITIGNTKITNQEFIKDYSKTSLSIVDSYLYPFNCIFNGHKQQLLSRGSSCMSISHYSPGCVCDNHITTTVKQIDFKDGKQIKQSYPSTFQVYRNRRHLLNYWQQGVIIVQYYNGIVSVHPIRIKRNNQGQYITSFDKFIITENSIQQPQNKIFFNSDMHVDQHDINAINLQQQFISKYQPDVYVNLGDLLNNKSLNHHEMQRGYFINNSFMSQFYEYCNMIKKMSQWANEKHIIVGNHQRFMYDFSNRFPQLKQLFDFLYISPLEQYNFIQHELKSIMNKNGLKFLHGDLRIFGQSGNYLQKISKTFGSDTIVGHLHVNEIKRGCYIVGLSGKYNQQYNDVNGSRWTQGFGFSNQYKGLNFTQLITINNGYNFILNKKIYNIQNNNNTNNTKISLIVK